MEIIRIKSLFLFLAAIFMVLPFSVNASDFVVNLYFDPDSKTLSFDKAYDKPVTLDKNTKPDYVSFSKDKTSGKYTLKLYDANNTDIIDTGFNQQKGAFSLKIPYFSIAYSMKIFDTASGKEILDADLSALSTCNGNGTCEFEKGENFNTCISDCANSHVNYSEQTKKLLEENGGTLKDPQTGQVFLKNLTPSDEYPSTSSSPIDFGKSTAPQTGQDDSQENETSSNPMAIIVILFIFIIIAVIGAIVFKRFFLKK